jgi:PAS domain S-box-containing protein
MNIIDFLPDATFVIDTEGKVIAWNRAMEVMTGVPAAEMLGKGDYEYALPFYGDRRPLLANLILMPGEEVERRYDTVIRDGDTLVVDIYIPTLGSGTYLWAKSSPLYDDQGAITGAIETVRDITDRKRAVMEMEQTKARLAGIFDFLPDPTFVIDTHGTLIAWNRAMEEMTGVPASAVVGKGDYEYALPFYGERRPLLANLILMPGEEVERRYDTVIRDGDTLVVDIYIPTLGNGTYLWAKASPLYDDHGAITGAIETVRDITERRLAEERLARANAELQIAAEIQQSFLPDSIPPIEGFDIAARSLMAKEVGGDFFDVIPFEVMSMEDETFGLLIADVSGKGIPAALFMALSRIVVRVNALWHRDPAVALHHANNFITHDSKTGMFVTLFYGILSARERTLTYVNAGHNPPLVYRRVDGSFEELTRTGLFLGGMEDQGYTSATTTIGADDVVVLYTDGITEANNLAEEMYGVERLRAVIRRHAGLPASGIVERIIADVTSFAVDMPQFDDITLMVIKGYGG